MWSTKFVVFFFTFYALAQGSVDFKCQKGQMVVLLNRYGNAKCAPCPPRNFQPEENKSQYCKACRVCSEVNGSETVEACTPVRNTICKCRENFIPLENDSITCQCAKGFTEQNGECVKKEEKNPTNADETIISSIPPSPHSKLNSSRPQEGDQTQKPALNITTPPTGQLSIKTVSIVGLSFLIVPLLALTALICKINLLPHSKRKPAHSRDPSFRIPVEESGDGSQDSLKRNQEES